MKPDFTSDLPLQTCIAAYEGYSFFADRTGARTKAGYEEWMSETYDTLLVVAQEHGTESVMEEEFPKFHSGYKRRYLDYLRSSSRCFSAMITGPANFPVRQQEKRHNVSHRRCSETLEYQSSGVARIMRKLVPSTYISSEDVDAIEKLITKIAVLEAEQEQMKRVNVLVRKYSKQPKDMQVAALMEIGETEEGARKLVEPDFCTRYGYASYCLTNNNANINRLKGRIKEIEKKRAMPSGELEGKRAKVELDPEGNRVRVFFSGKPERSVCEELKRAGFRWAPSLGAWSAYHNVRSIESAKTIAGVSGG